MKTYESLITNLCEHDWEDLSEKEKTKLVNSYILYKPIEIPCQIEFKRIVFNILNKDKIERDEHLLLKNLLFLSVKRKIEKDLEEEWSDVHSTSDE